MWVAPYGGSLTTKRRLTSSSTVTAAALTDQNLSSALFWTQDQGLVRNPFLRPSTPDCDCGKITTGFLVSLENSDYYPQSHRLLTASQ